MAQVGTEAKVEAFEARHHALSLQYVGLWITTRILRIFLSITLWINPFPPFNNPNVVRTEGFIASRDKGRNIRVRWYRPVSAAADEALPVLVHFHGSGFIMPLFGQDEEWCASVAERVRMLVIDADYRKAPEEPFPLGSEDAEDVALHVLALGRHPTLSLSGFSAGGSIALGLATVLGPERVHSIVTFYPSVDAATDVSTNIKDPFLSPKIMRHMMACYVLPGTSLQNPRLNAAFARMQDMPPHVLVVTGANDPLHGAASAFIARLQREGHPDAVFVSVPGGQHGFDRAAPVSARLSPIGQEKYEEAIAFLNQIRLVP